MGGSSASDQGLPFGRLLRQCRSAEGLSREELAQRSGLSVRAIGDMERGSTARPFNRSVRLLADALNLSGSARHEFLRAASGGPAGLSVPRQLPAALRQFAGRERELAVLGGLLDQAPASAAASVVTVSGMAGVGKTALAVQFAHRAAADFPGGQLYLNLQGFGPAGTTSSPAEALREILDALGVPPSRIPGPLGAQAALYRDRVAGRRLLVVLDNARDGEQVRPLLPASPGCLVIVTSRDELAGLAVLSGARQMTLGALSDGEARDLLAGRLGTARVAAEPGAVSELISACGRLPLALAIVSARAGARADFPLGALAAELREAEARLDALDSGDPAASMRAVFTVSYQLLSVPAARMFRLLGVHPGPDANVSAAASLAAVSASDARHQLQELTRGHLLTETAPGRFTLHDLLRVYAAEQAAATEKPAGRHRALARVMDHYLHTGFTAALLLMPERHVISLGPPQPGVTPEPLADDRQAIRWFQAEQRVLKAAAARAAEAGFNAHAWQLPWTIRDFQDRQGQWHQQVPMHQVALAAAERLGDKAAQATVGRMLAYAYTRIRGYDEATAQLAECLSLYRQLGDQAGEAMTYMTLGWVAEHQECYRDALEHTQQALSLFRALDHRPGQAAALNNAGLYHSLLGDYARARDFCQQALAMHRQLGARGGEAATWDSLGVAEHRLGRLDAAIACYQHALRIAAEIGDRFAESEILSHLGDVHRDALRPQEAGDAWRQALRILADLDHPSAAQVRAKVSTLTGPG